MIGPQPRDVDVAVGQVGRRRHRREQLGVLRGHGRVDGGAWLAGERRPEPGRELARRVELLRGPQRDELPRRFGAEQVGEYPARMVRVVEEKQQVAEADQRVSAVAGAAERVGPAVHIADHVDPH